jgi:3-dehydroquinate synthase class II
MKDPSLDRSATHAIEDPMTEEEIENAMAVSEELRFKFVETARTGIKIARDAGFDERAAIAAIQTMDEVEAMLMAIVVAPIYSRDPRPGLFPAGRNVEARRDR